MLIALKQKEKEIIYMITTHYSPSDFKRGSTAKTKSELMTFILGREYNTKPKYKVKDRTVNNFKRVVNQDGEDCTTFTIRYGRQPLASFLYDEQQPKEDFIKEVLAYTKDNEALIDKAWRIYKEISKTNGLNAKGGGSLQVVS